MSSMEIKSYLNQYTIVLGIFVLSLVIANNAMAWEDYKFTPDHLSSDRSVWNSGAIDARIGGPIGFDGSADYILEYTEERDRIRHEEILEAIEELDNE